MSDMKYCPVYEADIGLDKHKTISQKRIGSYRCVSLGLYLFYKVVKPFTSVRLSL